ncbi:MAG: hypothetical protein IPN69_02845 [Acidobacteria bacterium]|nr:hypothetical protein [Acidobacteriota bacterium]
MNSSIKIALLASGIFLMTGMLTGVWKYAKIMSSPEHRAPAYVNLAHMASFFYAFASLIIAKLIEFSPFSAGFQTLIVSVPITFFVLTVAGYIREGLLNRTENMFAERTFVTTTFMYLLIAGEIGGFALILGGFIYTQILGLGAVN